MDETVVSALIDQYEKHGWRLRILLRSEGSSVPKLTWPDDVLTLNSELDALWFSRPNGTKESWELRRIGGSPFALVRFIEADDPQTVREDILRSAELEMLGAATDPVGN